MPDLWYEIVARMGTWLDCERQPPSGSDARVIDLDNSPGNPLSTAGDPFLDVIVDDRADLVIV